MAPHPIPANHPIPTPGIQERFKRRLQTPEAMAPSPRNRKIQVLSWAVSLCKLPDRNRSTARDFSTFIDLTFFYSYYLALSAYVVLFADFGTEKNCYTPVSVFCDKA